MIKLHEMVPARPQTINEKEGGQGKTEAKVVYIHPEGRYYILEFKYASGSFCETRFFTEEEKAIGRRQNLFRPVKPSSPPRSAPPGFMTATYAFDEDPFEEDYDPERKQALDNGDFALLF